MLKAYEVMTHTLTVCTPDTSVAEAAGLMRDHDIGNILIVEDGKLRGIVTDRDLAVQALTGNCDPLQTPVRKFMHANVFTGESDWSLARVAKTMARHQIRRLPILQDNQLVGIVSLGDLASHEDRKHTVIKMLNEISEPLNGSGGMHLGSIRTWIGLSAAVLGTSMMAWFTWNLTHKRQREKIARNRIAA